MEMSGDEPKLKEVKKVPEEVGDSSSSSNTNSMEKASTIDKNLTISTKLSTDQLICKSPRDSPISTSKKAAAKSKELLHQYVESGGSSSDISALNAGRAETDMLVYLGLLQMLFGIMMVVFGVLVLVHDASLSQICGGVWGGCVALSSGLLALGAAARDCCPLRRGIARVALTAHLALSLVALAVANLVLVIAAIGVARDSHRTDEQIVYLEKQQNSDVTTRRPIATDFNTGDSVSVGEVSLFGETADVWAALLANIGLLISCACEVVAASFSVWRCTRTLCPCFEHPSRRTGGLADVVSVVAANGGPGSVNTKDVLVSAWLGKQPLGATSVTAVTTLPTGVSPAAIPAPPSSVVTATPAPPPGPPPVFVVATKKTLMRHGMTPMYAMAPPPPMLGYPMPVPMSAPTYLVPHHVHRRPIRTHRHTHGHAHSTHDNTMYRKRKHYPSDQQLRSTLSEPGLTKREKKSHRSEKKNITEADVVRTYTGLDRTIAEQFIEQCDTTRNQNSVCSKSEESSGSGFDTSLTNSDVASNEYLVEKL